MVSRRVHRAIANVQYPSPHHLYWPDLDIDLAVESIEHPEKYPLVSKVQTHDVGQPPRRTKKTKGKKPRRP